MRRQTTRVPPVPAPARIEPTMLVTFVVLVVASIAARPDLVMPMLQAVMGMC